MLQKTNIMKKIRYFFLILLLISTVACNSNDEEENLGNCETCTYTPKPNETAGIAPSSLEGTYNVVLDFATAQSPFPEGTAATFTLSSNILTVEISGEACITLENPIQTGTSEWTFIDNCRDNYIYGISQNQNGEFNEINLGTTNFQFLGQFK